MSKHSLPFLFLFLTITLSFTVLAGTLLTNESATPEPTMYTLGDIHNLIVNNQTATLGNHALSSTTVSTSATTSYSVSQIYAELANLIKRENVATGTTYLNITGDYDNPDPAYATTTIITSSLTPSDPQGNFSGYTLDDIYNLITSNSTTTPTSFDDLPDSTPANTMSSLTDIYEALIALGEEKAPKVKEGVEYLGSVGSYVPSTTDGLVSYWPFSGNASDIVGGHNGVVDGAVLSAGVNGQADSAYNFDGTNDKIEIPSTPDLILTDALTLSVWVRFDTFADGSPENLKDTIINHRGLGSFDTTNSYLLNYTNNLSVNPNMLTVIIEDSMGSTTGFVASTSISYTFSNNRVDTWYHLVLTYDGTTKNLYLDGELIGTGDAIAPIVYNEARSTYLGVDDDVSGFNDYFDGSIDELRIYNRALDTDEIQALYQNDKP